MATKCSNIYLLCLIACVWHLCAARQLQLPANVAAVASASTTTTTTTTTATTPASAAGATTAIKAASNSNIVEQVRHESYDNIDDDIDAETADTVPLRRRRQVSDWFIAPNTRWCGRGNTANDTYNQLGGASTADKCCRKHDHCKMFIPAMDSRYELFNYRPYTLSHCNCDLRFRTCLKMATDEDANTIGKIFFNIVQTQCFVLRKEPVCQQHSLVNGVNKCTKKSVRHKAYLKDNLKF